MVRRLSRLLARFMAAEHGRASGRSSGWARAAVYAAIAGPFLWTFWPVLLGAEAFVYRDAAAFYYPLFSWTCDEWGAGRIPLWNPHDNCGAPALADATSSVLYPGKLLFALPLAYPTRYAWYVTAHVVLAAAGAYGFARHWRVSVTAAGACAVSYAFGGHVLFQYSNVVYLVGAAWLPFSLWAACRTIEQRRAGQAALFGLTLAAMTLGGDPQSAYHAGLLASLYALISWRAERRRGEPTQRVPFGQRRPVLLALGAATGAVLAAAQIVPSVELARRGDRAPYALPRSVYEVPAFLMRPRAQRRTGPSPRPAEETAAVREDEQAAPPRGWAGVAAGLLGPPLPRTHHAAAYRMSVSPYALVQLLWPGLRGHRFATQPLQSWTPSLYLGLLPLLLALSAWHLRGGSAHVRWLSWAALLGTWAAMGSLGPGLLFERAGLQVGRATGGPYWTMAVLLPGYSSFRYPAKLFVVATLALSVLAALGWDRTFAAPRRGLRRALAGVGIASAVLAVLAAVLGPSWDAARAGVDHASGPLAELGSSPALRAAFAHTSALATALWWLLGRAGRAPSALLANAALLVVALELALANGWMAASATSRMLADEPRAAQIIARHAAGDTDGRPYRVFRAFDPGPLPPDGASAAEITALTHAAHDTLFPKFHLLSSTSLVEAYNNGINASAFCELFAQAWEHGPGAMPLSNVLDACAARYLILTSPPRETALVPLAAPELPGVALYHNPRSFPRAWIVHRVAVLPPLRSADPARRDERARQVLFHAGRPRDLRTSATVETARSLPAIAAPARGESEHARVTVDTPQHVEIEAVLHAPGLVVLSDTFYPGWTARVASDGRAPADVPILRTNRFMRGVALPAGRHTIVHRYRPPSFLAGAALSAVGCITLLSLLVARLLRGGARAGRADAGRR